ncbi:glycosyltransferase family 1 protein [Aquimarina sp. Aq78]|uniref:glycosyltransferase family 1 protein n=1 Tax=Aquimarina sp. Aq78 TaxID=1191889 RepID=UPI000D0EBB12|nr:glycosyltransferase family 1 protein [Aquimarina sp. Aq78]
MEKTITSNPILLIGKIPPPIGGVTIHVQRLLEKLKTNYEGNFHFKTLNKKNLLLSFLFILKYSYFHIHTSNVYLRLYYVLLGKIFGSKCIITIHGDIGRYNSKLKNKLDVFVLKCATYPILLNENSLQKALRLNKNSVLISSFIPPNMNKEFMSDDLKENIVQFKSIYKNVFCTNAYNFSKDKNDSEIYGIFEIINYFTDNQDKGLIFSDPSGAYLTEFRKRNIKTPKNILHITGDHSFFKVLNLSDFSIRNTSTDGDSISVKESLFLNKITFCTDVVSRPKGVFLYKRGDLKNTIHNFFNNSISQPHNNLVVDGSVQIIELYKNIK